MPTLDKRLLDEIIRLTRKYAKTGDVDLLEAKHRFAERASIHAFGRDSKWLSISDMVSSVLGPNGLNPSAPNSVIYRAFEAVGTAVQGKVAGPEEEKEDRPDE